ncbi:low molecular weight protein arginine phosphatase [Anoxynatronum buryatiense]|uniref:Protein-tyrosine phosphatase n=1 Tax=Anoxynatronum buryatiense TaxID=489973 RepID=A0AA46AJ03_9CLOT|nr:low molecular weight protein arginine phosphatase [Anoxynatronum buryatiense]SMP54937.1 protein-tyrosine phosphatase [Anoxynatronum buryatiense]
MKTILFVCTGNTCRSPMAAALLQGTLNRLGIGEDQISVLSAGIFASEGQPASFQAVEVMQEKELPLENHRSRRVTPRLLESADLIFTMTAAHRQSVLMMDAAAAGRVFTLTEYVTGDPEAGEVPDPFGGSVTVYRQTADYLETLIHQLALQLKERVVEGR